MYVTSLITECDFTGETFDNPVFGAEIIGQSGTGKYCCVMTCSSAYLKKVGIPSIPYEVAVEACMVKLREQNDLRPEFGRYTEDELRGFIDF
ncbi:MAG: hypothetical protein KAS32_20965 [Candidatus Peribacteraceae bacterium]|nr:hypothetical protein [Candidatus Peribacteraceae bacterium]